MTNVVFWADKGGVGKTSLATNMAVTIVGATLLDLDPQGDAARWAEKRGMACLTIDPDDAKAVQAALLAPGLKVVDCPPGQGKGPLSAVALADILVIPTRTGAADMTALGRSMQVVRRVKAVRPELLVGLVLNLARETGRAKGIEAVLRSQSGGEYSYLGKMAARVAVEEAYADARTLLQVGGATAHEFRTILEAVRNLLESLDSCNMSDMLDSRETRVN